MRSTYGTPPVCGTQASEPEHGAAVLKLQEDWMIRLGNITARAA